MRVLIILMLLVLTFNEGRGDVTFGYISNSTVNIGDDIQTIAARQFLPENAVAVDREFISEFTYERPVETVVSGWFMHEGHTYWEIPKSPPALSWPPSSTVHPFFISIHLTGTFLPTVFSDSNINYLKKYEPIGARDYYTLNELQKRGIDSYFSGCLTLTLKNEITEARNDIVYLVDLDQDTINYIKSKTTSPVEVITHGKTILQLLSVEHRLKYAEHLLNLYRRCKCVVTTRLHAAMPCLAFGTPVLMMAGHGELCIDPRFTGLIEHTNYCSKNALLRGEIDYNFDNPPENPNTHIPIRDNLIQKLQEWVREIESFYNKNGEQNV